MKSGIYIANYALQGEPEKFIELAKEAEANGWNGFFLWDHIYPIVEEPQSVAEPWITLAGIAAVTDTMRLGTTVTPLPRRKPWELAQECVTLDRLSGGRFTLGIGLGSSQEDSVFGEETTLKVRGELMDETLDILQGLWSGEEFSYVGKHYRIGPVTFLPRPKQAKIPIWCGGNWPWKGPFKRAARYDGAFPLGRDEWLTPKDFQDILEYVNQFREAKGEFDMLQVVQTQKVPSELDWIQEFADAGATWLMECFMGNDFDQMLARVRKGPFDL